MIKLKHEEPLPSFLPCMEVGELSPSEGDITVIWCPGDDGTVHMDEILLDVVLDILEEAEKEETA